MGMPEKPLRVIVDGIVLHETYTDGSKEDVASALELLLQAIRDGEYDDDFDE